MAVHSVTSSPPADGALRVAAAQFFSGTDVSANAQVCVDYIARAATSGARLIVLPENSNRVRDYSSREDCFDRTENLDGDFIAAIAAACAANDIYAVVGVDVRGETRPDVHIVSVLIDPSGTVLHVHRKHVLWDYEYTLFVPGTEQLTVIDTPIGRLGLLMCADGIVPDVPRTLALLGTQILCNSLNSRGPDELRVHVPLRAIENHVWHIAANTVGGPADAYPWMGGSQIVSPTGVSLACAGEEDEGMVFADIDVDAADDKQVTGMVDVFAWRRTDLYSDLIAPHSSLPVAPMLGPAADDLPAKPVTVATLQVSYFHNHEWTVTRALSQIEHAAGRGAQLGVLPQMFCFGRGDVAADPESAAAASKSVLARIREAAAAHSIFVVVHLVEAADSQYFSTAYLIADDGSIALAYRKTHLDDSESTWASPGDDIPVASTSLGRIGLLIGNEIWVPEVARLLTLRGAELIVHPTDWDRREAADMAATERTEENRVHIVSCTRLDNPAEIGSQIIRADLFVPGQPIALMRYPSGTWSRHGFEEQMLVELDLRESHSKMMGFHLDPVGTRMPDLYGPLVRERTTAGV